MPFDPSKIQRAVERCYAEVGDTTHYPAADLADWVAESAASNPAMYHVEEIQDLVEKILMEQGEHEAAKRYILYRADHARQRDERPIPDHVRAAFDADTPYFPTALQRWQFMDKYARYNQSLGRRETWVETVDRTVDFLHELAGDRLGREVYERIRRGILNMEVMPSMRLLAMAGAPARRDNTTLYNCFSSDTRFVTDQGPRYMGPMVGQSVRVLAADGTYRDAKVQSFGRQMLNRITITHWNGGKHGNETYTVLATPNHRWLLLDGSETSDLRLGDKLRQSADVLVDADEDAIRHGFVFGDGTLSRQNGVEYAQVRLCGKKAVAVGAYFSDFKQSYPPSYGGDPMVYCGRDNAHWKQLPPQDMITPEYVKGFIQGLVEADGSKTSGGNTRIDTQDAALVAWLRDYAPMAGYKILSQRTYNEPTNYGPRSAPLHQILLGQGESAIMRVISITPHGEEEVYCVVEPTTHTFTLGNGQVTGNCSYQAIDSLDAFPEALLISMAGCGVGFSVERKFVEKLPTIKPQNGLHSPPDEYTVEDSAEGWARALRFGVNLWVDGGDIAFDYSQIRPQGAVLLTKGGRASGPEPLKHMLDFVRSTILARQGQKLRPIDCHDIMCEVGNAAVSGGVRRTAMISLFDEDDHDMLMAKAPGFEQFHNRRWNANNSMVWKDTATTDQSVFIDRFMTMVKSGNGEPGIFSRKNAQLMMPQRRDKSYDFGTNPCGEIVLRSNQFCNLSAAVVRASDTYASLADKVALATIIGTIQSMATHFPNLRPIWKQNCDEERLLGVDITGQQDNPRLLTTETFRNLRYSAVKVNRLMSGLLGINQSASITCVKPSGNTSTLVNCSSGLHARWAKFQVKRVRVAATSPTYKVLRDAGVPLSPENGQTAEDAVTWVASFPVKAPEGAITKNDLTAVDQCEWWLRNKINWTEHNPSVTITYKPDEVIDLMQWVWNHRDKIGGMSFLPNFDIKLDQLPNEEISEAEYERLVAAFPKQIDWSRIYRYEAEDMSKASTTGACEGPVCLINEG